MDNDLRLPAIRPPDDVVSLARLLAVRTGVPTAIYARISDAGEQGRTGVERQMRLCLELLKKSDGRLTGIYVDNSKSAYRDTSTRLEYDDLMVSVVSGTVAQIVAYAPDRLQRHMGRGAEFVEIGARHKLMVRTKVSGDFDLAKGQDQDDMLAAILSARRESRVKSERVRDKLSELALTGEPAGGRRMFGFAADRKTPLEPEFSAIADAVEDVLTGRKSRYRVCKEWNDKGLLTVSGKFWTTIRWTRTFTGPRYAGFRVHQGAVVGNGNWPAPLTETMWRELCERFRSADHAPAEPRRSLKLLGSGIYSCGRCGGPMDSGGTTADSKSAKYRCRHHRHLTRAAPHVDAHVLAVVADLLDETYEGPAPMDTSHQEQLKREIARIGEDRRLAASQFGEGSITGQMFSEIDKGLRRQLRHVEAEQLEIAQQFWNQDLSGSGGDFLHSTIERQRQIVDQAFRVILMPSTPGRNIFDADSVRIERR